MVHVNNYAKIPNVRITALCDVDERLFPAASAEVEKLFGNKPRTEVDFRKLIEDKDIDIISVATPDHWHGLIPYGPARQEKMYTWKNLLTS